MKEIMRTDPVWNHITSMRQRAMPYPNAKAIFENEDSELVLLKGEGNVRATDGPKRPGSKISLLQRKFSKTISATGETLELNAKAFQSPELRNHVA